MKTKKLVEKVAVVPSESNGICAAIAKLMRRRSVIDIVERFQTKRALQEDGKRRISPRRGTARSLRALSV